MSRVALPVLRAAGGTPKHLLRQPSLGVALAPSSNSCCGTRSFVTQPFRGRAHGERNGGHQDGRWRWWGSRSGSSAWVFAAGSATVALEAVRRRAECERGSSLPQVEGVEQLGSLDQRFRIEATLGEGGQAIVYKAYDKKSKRMVAIKVTPKSHEQAAALVTTEVALFRSVGVHSNVVSLHDVLETPDAFVMVVPHATPPATGRAHEGPPDSPRGIPQHLPRPHQTRRRACASTGHQSGGRWSPFRRDRAGRESLGSAGASLPAQPAPARHLRTKRAPARPCCLRVRCRADPLRGDARGRQATTCCRCPPPRTKWTRRVPHPVLIGHAASLSQVTQGLLHMHRMKARDAAPRSVRRVQLVRGEGRGVSA